MIADKSITIWHYDGNGYIRNVFPKAHVFSVEKIEKSGLKQQKGIRDASVCEIRIPSKGTLPVYNEDWVRIGNHTGEPDRTADLKVVEVSNNIIGATPHIRILCARYR